MQKKIIEPELPARKFRIGEEVICEGSRLSKLIQIFGFSFYVRMPWRVRSQTTGFIAHTCYGLGGFSCWVYLVRGNWWVEPCLRRKHDPSSKTFDEIIKTLQSPIKAARHETQ